MKPAVAGDVPDPASPGVIPARRRLSAEQYVEGILAGSRGVLSRAITLLESRRPDDAATARRMLDALLPHAGRSVRVGITGVPGAGKSTLIEALGGTLTAGGRKLAVLTIDPSSRISGGSILGDKTRMATLARDPNAFIRPSPSGEALGGVARATREAMLTCEAAGFDVVFVETVGVGQSETVVADMVDTFLVLMIPGAGDELQGIKRGLLELADVIAVNKADGDNRPRAMRAVTQYQTAMRLMHDPSSPWLPPVVPCSALERTGLDAVWAKVLEHRATLDRAGLLEERRRGQRVRWMWDLVDAGLRRGLRDNPAIRELADALEADVRAGRASAAAASEQILGAIGLN